MPDPAYAKGSGAAEIAIAAVLTSVQRRWRLRSIAWAIAAGGAIFGVSLVLALVVFDATRVTAIGIAVLAGVTAAVWIALGSGELSAVEAARAVERTSDTFDNLLVTAAELEERPRPVRAEMRDEIFRQATERARAVDPAATVPLRQPVAVATIVLIGCAILMGLGTESLPGLVAGAPVDQGAGVAAGSFEVRVVPPAYTKRQAETLRDPVQISVIAGSRVQIPAARRDWIATESAAIEIATGDASESRFLSVIVVPDLPPSLRIVTPGKDTAFSVPKGQVAISIQSGDDLGLSSLSLRFTRASGGGESVAFTEGEVPLRLERRNEREWRGRADLALDTLGLNDGDILVYRAIARDTNPQGTPSQSDQYLIEIGKNAEIADAGFALPSEDKKYAISQQMVIYKTEQLMASSGKSLPSRSLGEGLEQSRFIGMEQRMVRAEVVFLGGGEIQDEVEEAAHSHEVAEGRLENSGRAEMLRAINAMSRAEAQLNDGRLTEALVFEREALAHLERALDRRRYFLRTLPDRSRIDATRRLTGERREAQSWTRDRQTSVPAGSIEAQRRVMRELASGLNLNAALAARMAAIDPSSVDLQNAAVVLASAATGNARQAAARAAMQVLTAHALKSLPSSSAAVGLRLNVLDPLAGRLADELRPRQ